jgi:hypothetical protein
MFSIHKLRSFVTILGLVGIIIALPILAQAQVADQAAIFDTAEVAITDLSGTAIGEGLHSGEERCINDNCFKKTQLQLNQPLTGLVTIEYRFETLQALVPDESRVVVTGTGTINSINQKEKFQFTAVIQDNMDGTLSVTYVASRPDASLMIPNAPGTFEITSRP